jgi:hypothetical protein
LRQSRGANYAGTAIVELTNLDVRVAIWKNETASRSTVSSASRLGADDQLCSVYFRFP